MPSTSSGNNLQKKSKFIRPLILVLILGAVIFLLWKIILLIQLKEEKKEALAPPPTLVQGSFTDLFSGAGWLDEEKTTAWHDPKTASLTLPPKYEWGEMSPILNGIQAVNFKKGGDKWLLTGTKGEIFVIQGHRKSSWTYDVQDISPPETAGYSLSGLDYLPESDRWVILGVKNNTAKIWTSDWTSDIPRMSDVPILKEILNLPVKGDADIACVKYQCLIQNGRELFVVSAEGAVRPFPLPSTLNAKPYTLSIGKTDSFWLVGAVWKAGRDRLGRDEYHGQIYKVIAGEAMSQILENDLVSIYSGVFSFGGNDDDFLAIYGAYEGQAYHFTKLQAPSSKFQTQNWSDSFNIRVMEEKGFKPQILKIGDRWYIGAGITLSKFLKIESGTAVDFTNSLLAGFQSNLLADGIDNDSVLSAAVSPGSTRIFIFQDFGFDNGKSRLVESKSVRSGVKIWSAKIAEAGGNTKNIRFYLSGDGGRSWSETQIGEWTLFKGKGNDLRWRAKLENEKNSRSTPSLNYIYIVYEIVK